MERTFKFLGLLLAFCLFFTAAWAVEENSAEDLKTVETTSQEIKQEQGQPKLALAEPSPDSKYDPVRYTLGPDDIVEITVMRHPEFSGIYPVNLEGKIQYKFVGDMDITGLTKKELEDKIKEVVSTFVISPEVNITITEYRSKIIYVLGEVGRPGKYFMRSDSILVREAVVEAGLPTLSAAMRKCRIITPDKNGRVKTRAVNLYEVLYGGDLRRNIEMHPGDVLYVPATVMAKVIRVINPVASTVGLASSPAEDVSTARKAMTTVK